MDYTELDKDCQNLTGSTMKSIVKLQTEKSSKALDNETKHTRLYLNNTNYPTCSHCKTLSFLSSTCMMFADTPHILSRVTLICKLMIHPLQDDLLTSRLAGLWVVYWWDSLTDFLLPWGKDGGQLNISEKRPPNHQKTTAHWSNCVTFQQIKPGATAKCSYKIENLIYHFLLRFIRWQREENDSRSIWKKSKCDIFTSHKRATMFCACSTSDQTELEELPRRNLY